MLEALPRAAFLTLARSTWLKRLASRYGMRPDRGFARRFIAGEDLAEAIAVARTLQAEGLTVTLDLLGESVASTEAAAEATHAYVQVVDAVREAGIDRYLSVKPTQLGLAIDQPTAIDNLRKLLDAAAAADVFVRLDMEDSSVTEATLTTAEALWTLGHRNLGVVIQSYLRRASADVQRVNALGLPVRLVKGAYREPSDIAFQRKTDVDRSFQSLMETLLSEGTRPAIATHDEAMIDATRDFAERRGIAPDAFEFQLLFGVRRDLQRRLVASGYRVRVYVPYGREWYPYFMRRLGERPANVSFVLKSLAREDRTRPS